MDLRGGRCRCARSPCMSDECERGEQGMHLEAGWECHLCGALRTRPASRGSPCRARVMVSCRCWHWLARLRNLTGGNTHLGAPTVSLDTAVDHRSLKLCSTRIRHSRWKTCL